jgi:hypothetical protein
MHVVFVEPRFPSNQRFFVKALKEVGATVTAIGEGSKDSLSGDLRQWLSHYEQVDSVVNEGAVLRAAKFIHSKKRIDRMEAVVEAHIMSTAKVREVMGIQGTSVKTSWLCRDKPSMKQALREAGVPCAQSAAANSVEDVIAFAKQVGFPLIIKPRDGAGASGTSRVNSIADIHRAAAELGLDRGRSVAVEEFIEGHEGFYDTITIGGRVVHEFVTHYYPNVLEAMRTRWINPQFVTTNRVDSAPRPRTWNGSRAPGGSSSAKSAAARPACARGTSTTSATTWTCTGSGRWRWCTVGPARAPRGALPPASSRCAPRKTVASPGTTASTRSSAHLASG